MWLSRVICKQYLVMLNIVLGILKENKLFDTVVN